jgi:UDP:flavonoid glycosyltransferase YjiC (YdhE family)
MKFVLANYGSRGDVEPFVAVGQELLRRGHDVSMAAPNDTLGFVESAGLTAVAYGLDSQAVEGFRDASKIQNQLGTLPGVIEHVTQTWAEKTTTLTAVADGADLLLAGYNQQRLAANVAEYYGIPLAALHIFPTQLLDFGWLHERITKEAEDVQRRALGLPETPGPATRSLEIQAYDELCFPGVAAQWAEQGLRRPIVGAVTMELPTAADDEVLSWAAAGTPPIYFGFGSMRITSPADTFAMISAACTELGERALICSGASDFTEIPHVDHVKVVGAAGLAAVFPACRAIVHHGGAGTTAASLRAGIPTLILGLWVEYPIWAAAVEGLKVGFGRQFSEATQEALIADLRCILTPQYAGRAREVGAQMTKPAESLARTADLLEDAARGAREP